MARRKKEGLIDLSGVVSRFHERADQLPKRDPNDKPGLKELKGNPVSVGSRVLTPDEWAEKQRKRAVAAAADWADRVRRPKRDPIVAALNAAEKRKDKLLKSIDEKKWEKAMEKVDKDLMYKTIEKTGAEGYRRGIETRAEKVAARVKELQPLVMEVAKTIDEMPNATDADREARLLAARKLMIEVGKKRRGTAG